MFSPVTLSSFYCVWYETRKLAKKRKETMSSTRQEMTVMVNSMDKSYTEQGTNCDEAISFMDTHSHTLNGRSECPTPGHCGWVGGWLGSLEGFSHY